MKLLIVIQGGEKHASSQVRAMQYLPHLRERGITTHTLIYSSHLVGIISAQSAKGGTASPREKIYRYLALRVIQFLASINRVAKHCKIYIALKKFAPDVILIQKVLLPKPTLQLLSSSDASIAYDFDDAVYLYNLKRFKNVATTANLILAGNASLQEYAERFSDNVVRLPSTVDTLTFSSIEIPKRQTPTIGWLGSPSTLGNLELISKPLHNLAANRRNGEFTFLVIGDMGRGVGDIHFKSIRIERIPSYLHHEIPSLMRRIDIGVMPLFATKYSECKCGMKALIYMAAKRPVVASPVGMIKDIVIDGYNGYLAASEQEWEKKLGLLISSRDTRIRVGLRGHITAREFDANRWVERLVSALKSLR